MKRFFITLCLLILLATSILVVIALYISGPNIKYETEVQNEIAVIKAQSEVEYIDMKRDVFRYVVYIAESDDAYAWYDRDGKALLHKFKKDIHVQDILTNVKDVYGISDVQGSIGYGYDNGVYIVENDEVKILLDIDTMKEIYYQRK